MFDKLKNLFENKPEKEFKPREQGRKPARTESAPVEQATQPGYKQLIGEHKSDGRSTSIGDDPFKGKLDGGSEQRIQSKIELIQKLQKELGINE